VSPRARTGARLGIRSGARQQLWWLTLLVAAIFYFITLHAKGGLNAEAMISTEMTLTLATGVVIAASVLLAPPGRRAYGAWSVGLLLAFTALSAVSIAWSVQPDISWQESGRMLAYSGVFAVGVALVRVVPDRWPAILGGLTLAAVAVCAYALLTKVFPSLAPLNMFARLNEPYGYWNAVGLTAALGAICCMWLGARRDGHALLRALAYPAMGLMLLTLVLAYSRGALVALALGLVLWFCVVPLRLRGAALLIVGATGAMAVAAWDFSKHALSSEGVPLAERATAGHELGALVVAMLALLTVAGIAIGFVTARRAPSLISRQRAGVLLLAAIVVAAIAFAGALAHSQRGFTGSISHTFDTLTNPNAKQPLNTPSRLTAVASVRARYWKEAFQVFDAHPLLGAGAGGYATAHQRYETQAVEVHHAHGFIVQTLADLGLVGLILSLALLLAWIAAARRPTDPLNRRGSPYSAERIGMLSMLCLVVVFGAHSLIDWTWYVPGNACVALLCAGWLAGRGELAGAGAGTRTLTGAGAHVQPPPAGAPRDRPSNTRIAVAAAVIVASLLAMWSQWQPQRSEEAAQQADAQLEAHRPAAAVADAHSAVSRDPLSIGALFTLAAVQRDSGHPRLARATLERAVRLQPSNPESWRALGRYELEDGDPASAVGALQAAIYLNPESISPEAIADGRPEAIKTQNDYIQALSAAEAQLESARRAAVLKSAREARAQAALRAHRAARRRSAPGSARSRTPRSAG
jgi:tetratricopeptide (TPR) repeat protein